MGGKLSVIFAFPSCTNFIDVFDKNMSVFEYNYEFVFALPLFRSLGQVLQGITRSEPASVSLRAVLPLDGLNTNTVKTQTQHILQTTVMVTIVHGCVVECNISRKKFK